MVVPVRTEPELLTSWMVTGEFELAETVAPLMIAVAPVNVTVPKLAKGTRELPEVKSSTIHSAEAPWGSWSALGS